MNRFFRTLPLPAKLMLIGLVPLVFMIFLTSSLYIEKKQKLDLLSGYIGKIEESANLTRLIDNLQLERVYSYEYVLNGGWQKEMLNQRTITDSIIGSLEAGSDSTLQGFTNYSFLFNIQETRKNIDSNRIDGNAVMHYFSAAIFRLNTLNGVSPGNIYLKTVYKDMAAQKLMSDMITYLGLVNANIYNILFHRTYVLETLAGTFPSFEVYKSYEQEFLQKASPEVIASYRNIKEKTEVKENIAYLNKVFATFKVDSSYSYKSWGALSLNSINDLRLFQTNLLQNVQQKTNEAFEKEKVEKSRSLIFLVIALALVVFIISYTIHMINIMLNELKRSAQKIARGEEVPPFENVPNDVIGSLARSISEIDASNKQLAEAANSIGDGNFDVLLEPRSEKDLLGNALLRMKENLQRSIRETEESREEFRKLADFVPQIVWTASAEGATDYYNKQWYEFTGMHLSQGDNDFAQYLHPDDRHPVSDSWQKAVLAGKSYETELRFRDKNGDYRWFLGRGVPIRNSEGNIVKWFGTCTDIHDRKTRSEQLEMLVQERTQELERSNDDLRQFAHVASHDLKEPMRKIRMFSSRLKDDFSQSIPEDGKMYIMKIQEAAKRMSSMIDGVLDYSVTSNSEQHFEPVDLNEIMAEISQDLELVIQQKNASIHYAKLPVIRGIRVLIYQLFYNLINNALKFSKENEKNNITISEKKVKGSDLNGSGNLVPGKEYISIEVNDEGIGFDPIHEEKMFQLFSRLNPKDKYEGTGLGLALCKKIALRHSGNIIAKGKENQGACFNVLLPA